MRERCKYCNVYTEMAHEQWCPVRPKIVPESCPQCEREQFIGKCPHNREHNVLTKRDAPACSYCGKIHEKRSQFAPCPLESSPYQQEPKPAEPAASRRSDVIGALRVIENNAGTLIRWANDPNLQSVRTAQSILKYAREALRSLGCQTSDEEITSKPAADERPALREWYIKESCLFVNNLDEDQRRTMDRMVDTVAGAYVHVREVKNDADNK